MNVWNLYSAYFKDNEKEELARLDHSIAHEDVDPAICRECYQAFLAKYGDHHAKVLLANHRRLRIVLRTQTYGERKADFKKASSKLAELMDSYESLHGFSGVFALLGNNANSDSGLAVVHETKDASGFFATRCRTDNDGVIAHLKAHVYVSMEVVKKTFGDGSDGITAGDTRGQSKVPATHPIAESSTAVARSSIAVAGSSKSVGSSRAVSGALVKMEDPASLEQKPLAAWVAECLVRMLDLLGIPGAMPWKQFPWKSLGIKFSKKGVILRNWPEGVPFPPVSDHKLYQALNKGKAKEQKVAKSVQNLSRNHLHFLYDAITHSEHPLTFEVFPDSSLESLQKGMEPIAYGAPPPHTSNHRFGRRLFVDGREDRYGPPRKQKPAGNGGDNGGVDGDDDEGNDGHYDNKNDSDGKEDAPSDVHSHHVSRVPSEKRALVPSSDSDESGTDAPARKKTKRAGARFRPVSVDFSNSPKPPRPSSSTAPYIEISDSESTPNPRPQGERLSDPRSHRGKHSHDVAPSKLHHPPGKRRLDTSEANTGFRPEATESAKGKGKERAGNTDTGPPRKRIRTIDPAATGSTSRLGDNANIRQDDRTDIRFGDRANARSDNRTDVRRDNRANTQLGNHTDIRRDDRPTIRRNDHADIRRNDRATPRPDNRTDISRNGRADIHRDEHADVRHDDRASAQPDHRADDLRLDGRYDHAHLGPGNYANIRLAERRPHSTEGSRSDTAPSIVSTTRDDMLLEDPSATGPDPNSPSIRSAMRGAQNNGMTAMWQPPIHHPEAWGAPPGYYTPFTFPPIYPPQYYSHAGQPLQNPYYLAGPSQPHRAMMPDPLQLPLATPFTRQMQLLPQGMAGQPPDPTALGTPQASPNVPSIPVPSEASGELPASGVPPENGSGRVV